MDFAHNVSAIWSSSGYEWAHDDFFHCFVDERVRKLHATTLATLEAELDRCTTPTGEGHR